MEFSDDGLRRLNCNQLWGVVFAIMLILQEKYNDAEAESDDQHGHDVHGGYQQPKRYQHQNYPNGHL